MRYVLLIEGDGTVDAPEEVRAETEVWVKEMDGRGVRLMGSELRVSDATTVRVRGDEVLLSDGPFAETKEQILGFDLIDAEDLDEAIEVASKHPSARLGSVEVRPLAQQ
jgi:hypothetical protein